MSTMLANDRIALIDEKYQEHSSKLMKSVKLIQDYSQIFSSYAHEHDYKDVKANGFRSMIKLGDKFIDFLSAHQLHKSHRSRDIELLERMADSLTTLYQFAETLREKMLTCASSDDDCPRNFSTDTMSNIATITSVGRLKDQLSSFFGRYANFQYSGHYRSALRIYMGAASIIWSGCSAKNIFNLITSPYNYTAENFSDYSMNCDAKTFSKIIHVFTNSYFTGVVSFFMNGVNKLSIISTKSLSPPSRFVIDKDGHLTESFPPIPPRKAIRCRYFLNRFDEKNDTLVVHVHGSAFLAMSPESFQILTRGWSEKMETVPILSVDYSLAPESKYPVALQELLDVYLYLLSGDEHVKKLLGFHPTRIIFTGDSAGANISMALLCLLNDLNKKLKAQIPLPKAYMLIYPVFAVSYSLTPSRLFALNDVILPINLVMEVIRAYIDLTDDLGEKQISDEELKKNWYLRDYPDQVFRDIQKKLETPYISPLFYDDWESLASVDLHLITSDYDVFLDDSVAMAHKWKGKVTLDVVPDLPHAFFNLMGSASEITAAYNLCADILCKCVRK